MQIFISYGHEDVDFARHVREQLQAWDYQTWLDSDNIPHGAYWPDAIDAGLKNSDVVIGVMTPDSVASRNVKNEWDWALKNEKPLFLLLLRECEVPHRYVSINYIDFTGGRPQGFAQLKEALANPDRSPYEDDAPGPHMLRIPTNTSERNRNRMLEKVKTFWINGVLENSLYGAALIELGMTSQPEAVEHPWGMILQHPTYPDYRLSADVRILDVFDDVGGELLILGEPGSGKTTTMLELARDLIARAQRDTDAPMPVVFNLSSWADERKSINKWLVDELNTRYQVPKQVGEIWVESAQILPLLDGLDEGAPAHRLACVEAINQFRLEHGLIPLVVCSRIADYEALTTRLKLQGAVVLQPLTPAQIQAYLASAGGELSAVRQALKTDAALQELAQTPLMLSIMTLAYRGLNVESLPATESIEERRAHLFGAYVRRMFERRGVGERYTQEQTIKWLNWLAAQMNRHAQTVFLIERLQPDWIKSRTQRWLYLILAWALVGLPIGIPLGIMIFLASTPLYGLFFGIVITLLFGVILGPIGDIAYQTPGGQIRIVEKLGWSWSSAAKGVGLGILIGVVAGIIVALARRQGALVSFSIAGASAFGLLGGLAGGLTGNEVEMRTAPNQGIRHSASNALRVGIPIGAAGVLAATVGIRLAYVMIFNLNVQIAQLVAFSELSYELVFGLLAGLTLGLAFSVFFGGLALARHFILRIMLAAQTPWNMAHFLDYAAERVFLRKVGGGYIFVHRLLLDYFAGLNPESPQKREEIHF
jgi:TIR domain/NACHT domain